MFLVSRIFNSMSIEIERKFLVSSNKRRVVRVRVLDKMGYITVKVKPYDSDTSRFELEKKASE